jgi:hypothetical protein
MSNQQVTIFDAINSQASAPTDPAAYAQKAIYGVMCNGAWYTTRQLMDLCKVSDPRANIRTMKNNGYVFETRWEKNSHGVRYKYYRLITQPTEVEQ